MFMTSIKIAECIDGLKLKNTEGFDRIPQRALIDGRGFLMGTLTELFKMIYRDQVIPEQWLISKIIPVHKKVTKVWWRTIDLWLIFAVSPKFLKN